MRWGVKEWLQCGVSITVLLSVLILFAVGVFRLCSRPALVGRGSVKDTEVDLGSMEKKSIEHQSAKWHVNKKTLFLPDYWVESPLAEKDLGPFLFIETLSPQIHSLSQQECFIQRLPFLKKQGSTFIIPLEKTKSFEDSRLRRYAVFINAKTQFRFVDLNSLNQKENSFLPPCESWFFIQKKKQPPPSQKERQGALFFDLTTNQCLLMPKKEWLGVNWQCENDRCPIQETQNGRIKIRGQVGVCGVHQGNAWGQIWFADGRPVQWARWSVHDNANSNLKAFKTKTHFKKTQKSKSTHVNPYFKRPYTMSGWD